MNMGIGMQPQFPGAMMEHYPEQTTLYQQSAEAFDEEAFARAFEEAAKEEQLEDGVKSGHEYDAGQVENAGFSTSAMELGQDIMLDETGDPLISSQIPEQARLGSDLIHDPMSEHQEQTEEEDHDALSRTAGQLLASVQSNQSNKFQNSEFLELMRQ